MADEGFTTFFEGDFDRLVGFLCKTGYHREIACDAAAEAMTCLLEQWSEVASPKAWVRTVANRIASRLVMEGPRSVNAAIAGCWATADRVDDRAQCAAVEEQPLVIELLRKLPDMQRLVMAWILDGFEPTEIAEQIGSTPTTVRSNLRHARARLKELYAAQTKSPTTKPRRRKQ